MKGKIILWRTVMNKKLFRVGLLACVLACGLVLVGCGDKDEGGGDSGEKAFTIKVSGLPVGEERYVFFSWDAGGAESASGYYPEHGTADASGVVTVKYIFDNDQFTGFASQELPVYIRVNTDDALFGALESKVRYTFGSKTVELTYPTDFDEE
ncbi:MAG: hypothetical protein LBO67_03975 [Spirochaetaceae bacterium]|jgi:hypothetical protein|nr:hypothetical protein [Spirochaetaceae bacterium]